MMHGHTNINEVKTRYKRVFKHPVLLQNFRPRHQFNQIIHHQKLITFITLIAHVFT